MSERHPTSSETGDDLYTAYNPDTVNGPARDENGDFDSAEARRLLQESGAMSYKEAVETPNSLLEAKLSEAGITAEADTSAKKLSVEDALDENGLFDSKKARELLVGAGVLSYKEAIETPNSLLKSKFEQGEAEVAHEQEQGEPHPHTRVIEVLAENSDEQAKELADLRESLAAQKVELERELADLNGRVTALEAQLASGTSPVEAPADDAQAEAVEAAAPATEVAAEVQPEVTTPSEEAPAVAAEAATQPEETPVEEAKATDARIENATRLDPIEVKPELSEEERDALERQIANRNQRIEQIEAVGIMNSSPESDESKAAAEKLRQEVADLKGKLGNQEVATQPAEESFEDAPSDTDTTKQNLEAFDEARKVEIEGLKKKIADHQGIIDRLKTDGIGNADPDSPLVLASIARHEEIIAKATQQIEALSAGDTAEATPAESKAKPLTAAEESVILAKIGPDKVAAYQAELAAFRDGKSQEEVNEFSDRKLRELAAESEQPAPEHESSAPSLDAMPTRTETVEEIAKTPTKMQKWLKRFLDTRIGRAGAKLLDRTRETAFVLDADLANAKAEASTTMYGDYREAIVGTKDRTARFEDEARQNLDNPSARDIKRYTAKKEREFNKSIGNTGWNHFKNLGRELRHKVNRENYSSDEAYQDAKSHKRKIAIGAIAIGLPVMAGVTFAGLRASGALEHMGDTSGAFEHAGDATSVAPLGDVPARHDEINDNTPHDHTDGIDTHHDTVDGTPEPGEFTADNIDVNYGEHASPDKISYNAMGLRMNMESTDTAQHDMWKLGESDPGHAAQMVDGYLDAAQIKELGLENMTPDQMKVALHDDALRAEALNTIHDTLESGAAKIEIVDHVSGDFYNWGAQRVLDENGNIIDTNLVQEQVHLNDLSLLKVTDRDGNISYFNSECKNFLTEAPHPEVPVKTEEKTGEKTAEKTGEKSIEKSEEKTFEKSNDEKTNEKTSEKTEEKTTEKTEEKTEEKTSEKSEEKTEEKTEEKSDEKTEEKTEEKSNDEKTTEEKTDVETVPKDPTDDSDENPDLGGGVGTGDDAPIEPGNPQDEGDVTTPPDVYVPPQPQPETPVVAPEADPVAPEVRDDEVEQAPTADNANGVVPAEVNQDLSNNGAGSLETDQNGNPVGNNGRVE